VSVHPKLLQRLIAEFCKFPGIGEKSAQRIAYFLLTQRRDSLDDLAELLTHARDEIRFCSSCCNLSDQDPCNICEDPERDRSTVCVVERPNNVAAVERAGEFKGMYHVLMGLLSPMNGIGPDDLKVQELLERLDRNEVSEVIIALNPTAEGESTALYLAGLMKPRGVRVSRIAMGLPVGGDIDYADPVTMMRALQGRQTL